MRYALLPLALLAALQAGRAEAQTPAQALAAKWNTICLTSVAGTLLATRCDETANSSAPNANLIAALGQRLNEIPGQARVATRDTAGSSLGLSIPQVGSPSVAAEFRQNYDGSLSMQLDGEIASHWSIFVSGDIGRLDRRAGQNEAAFAADTSSLTAGVDWQPNDRWSVGLALNHVRESLDYDGTAGAVDTRFSGVLVTASRSLGQHWSVDAYAGWLNGDYELQREIRYTLPFGPGSITISGMATANPDASRRVQGVAVNGQWSYKGWNPSVAIGMDGGRTTIEAYQETGGIGLDLLVPGRKIDTRRGHVDFGISRAFSQDWGVWQPMARVSWFNEFSNPRRQVTLRLASDVARNGVSFNTEDPDKGWGEVAIGSVFVFTHGHSGFIQYQQRFGHAFLQERMLALGWRMEL
ncbi:autotransporter outer membrane beta-barrel domain-containing protein [Arenimonas sp.]|uniref:autotransporter outer membrane beta-barrel domain-containing protein n=1 Tax=Arenimonas sp. TaxID=1872635 RepID=UPI0039E6FD40